jgi:L-fucose mutarotase
MLWLASCRHKCGEHLIAVTLAPMLKHLPALLTPDLLHALASLGHGDEVVIADAHFPAASLAARQGARLLRVPGADTPQLLRAVLERFAFYERAAQAFAIIQCGESRIYGNVLLRAGVWTGEAQ